MGVIQKLKEDLVCLLIVYRGTCQAGDGIIDHHADEEGQEHPS
jgi:hypothetical protein